MKLIQVKLILFFRLGQGNKQLLYHYVSHYYFDLTNHNVPGFPSFHDKTLAQVLHQPFFPWSQCKDWCLGCESGERKMVIINYHKCTVIYMKFN